MKTRSSRNRPESWRWERDTQLISVVTPSDTSVTCFSDRYHSLPIHRCFPSQIHPWYLYFLYLLLLTLFCVGDPLTLIFLSQASIPFAVIGSNQLIEVKGKKIRGRLYPWGVVEVENPEHNDFLKLRTMLVWVCKNCLINRSFGRKGFKTLTKFLPDLVGCKGLLKEKDHSKALLPPSVYRKNCMSVCYRTHMQDLQEVTQDLHYENFRSERLKRAGRWDTNAPHSNSRLDPLFEVTCFLFCFFFIHVFCFVWFLYRAVDEDVLDKDQILLQKEAEVGTYTAACQLCLILSLGWSTNKWVAVHTCMQPRTN